MSKTAAKQQKNNLDSSYGKSKSINRTPINSSLKRSQSQYIGGDGGSIQNIKGSFQQIPYQVSGEIRENDVVWEILCDKPSVNKKLVHLADYSATNKINPKVQLELENQPNALPTLVNFSNEIINDLKKYGVLSDIENRKFTLLACQTLVENVILKDTSIDTLNLKNESLHSSGIRDEWKEKAKKHAEKEFEILNQLTDQDCVIIEEALEIIKSKQSLFLVNLFKSATSVSEIEFSKIYDIPTFNFEAEKASWSLAGWSDVLQARLKIGIASGLPKFFRKWLDDLRERRRSLV